MEFLKFMLGMYWNDTDSNAVGGRETLVFCWLMSLIGVVLPAAIVICAI